MNDPSELRHAFAEWLDPRGAAAVNGTAPHQPAPPSPAVSPDASVPIARRTPGELLYALWDDQTPVPAELRDLHALPAETSYSDLARMLYVHWDTGDVSSLEVARDGLSDRGTQDLHAELEQVRRTGMATA